MVPHSRAERFNDYRNDNDENQAKEGPEMREFTLYGISVQTYIIVILLRIR